jgi:antitoxin VapB
VGLNIKNERTHRLVRELAERTGLSQTSAVEEAVVHYLRELTEPDVDQAAADQVAARRDRIDLVRSHAPVDVGSRLPHDVRRQADDTLYDESGLYK